MKKIVIFFVIVIAILGVFWYIYEEHKILTSQKIAFNGSYEELIDKDVNGSKLASVINESIDRNEKNKVKKDSKKLYIDNGSNSVQIEIKFIDSPSTIRAEKLYYNDISKFIELYSNSIFKLKTLEYHSKTNLVRYLYFEEVEE